MKLIICLDERCGMAFNGRRQSRDRVLIADLAHHVGTSPLYVTPYSAALLADAIPDLHVAEDPQSAATPDAWCFLETLAPDPTRLPDTLLIYRWNRHYPADLAFSLPMDGYRLAETSDFIGSSHKKITKEVWTR